MVALGLNISRARVGLFYDSSCFKMCAPFLKGIVAGK